ncbi:MAG: hypothetical protein QM621_09960 [Aeromicrobium sp.]|uniref:hypothetical protein n=1 Tax=Aeromicrobium sp. TaxID=1871063 RepID=UPI0039E5BBB8
MTAMTLPSTRHAARWARHVLALALALILMGSMVVSATAPASAAEVEPTPTPEATAPTLAWTADALTVAAGQTAELTVTVVGAEGADHTLDLLRWDAAAGAAGEFVALTDEQHPQFTQEGVVSGEHTFELAGVTEAENGARYQARLRPAADLAATSALSAPLTLTVTPAPTSPEPHVDEAAPSAPQADPSVITPFAAEASEPPVEYTAPDGAKMWVPSTWVEGEDLVVTGEGWLTSEGQPSGIVFSTQSPRVTFDESVTVFADASGAWSARIPYPTPDNSNLAAAWAAGQTVRLRAVSGASVAGDVVRSVQSDPVTVVGGGSSEPVVPSFTAQPADVTVDEGGDAEFSVSASGEPEPSLRWESSTNGTDWAVVAGETGETLRLSGVQVAQSGTKYRAVAVNSAGEVASNPATLTVTPTSLTAPVVSTQPQSASVRAGESASFTAAATGHPTPAVRWESSVDDGASWSPVAGATTGTLALNAVAEDMTGTRYRAVFTNSEGSDTTAEATLTVTDPGDIPVGGRPYVTVQPQDAAHTKDSMLVYFRAEVAATTPPDSVQWEYKLPGTDTWSREWRLNNDVTRTLGATESGDYVSTLPVGAGYLGTATGNSVANGTQYRAVFVNADGTTVTEPATLTRPEPTFQVVGDGPYRIGDTINLEYNGPNGSWKYFLVTPDGHSINMQAGNQYGEVPGSETWGDAFRSSYTVPWRYVLEANSNPGHSNGDVAQFKPGAAQVQLRSGDVVIASQEIELAPREGDDQPHRITVQPEDQSAAVGEWVEFRAEYEASGAYDICWLTIGRDTPAGYCTPAQSNGGFVVSYENGVAIFRMKIGSAYNYNLQLQLAISNASGYELSRVAGLQSPEPVDVTADLPATAVTGAGQPTTLTATATGKPRPSATWYSSADGQDWTEVTGGEVAATNSDAWTTTSTLTFAQTAAEQNGLRYKAVFGNGLTTDETRALALTVAADDVPVSLGDHPADVTVEAGGDAVFTAGATGVPSPTVQWESSTDGTTWSPVAGATGATLKLAGVTVAKNGTRYRAVFTNSASPDGVATEAATLTVVPRAVIREYCGKHYGPREADAGHEFCFKGPEKVVVGEPIVIEGVGGYLATDDTTGSVVNFFLDAEFSGDPKTLYSTREVKHPVTGAAITDDRSHAVVQANPDGTWRVEIPFPTNENAYTTPAQDVAELWKTGTNHSVRMLTGSLLTSPADRQGGASLYFTVVDSLDEEVRPGVPAYEHQTFDSEVAGDEAVAWLQQSVETSSGQIKLSGNGWLTADKSGPSRLVVRLVDEDGTPLRRTGADVIDGDPTIWQVVDARDNGDLDTALELPEDAAPGDYLAVRIDTSPDTLAGDVARHWESAPLEIDGQTYLPPLTGTCTAGETEYTYELAPGMAVPAANVGGTIRLTGQKWCNKVGTGSLIAVKINAGGYSHKGAESAEIVNAATGEVGTCQATVCLTNKTIWYVIEAEDDGSFDVEIPLPDRSNSVPGFAEGSYTLQLLTRTIAADPYYEGQRPDPSRSLATPEFTVVAEGVPLDDVKPGKPSAPPEALHVDDDLPTSAQGGLTVSQQATQWVVKVPNAEPGDWVYASMFDGPSPRLPWGSEWFQVSATGTIALPLAGATLPVGSNKFAVQARDGSPLGWTWVEVEAPAETPKPQTPSAPATSGQAASGATAVASSSGSGSSGGVALAAGTVSQPKPGHTPPAPVEHYRDLTSANVGPVVGVESEGNLVVTLPSVEPGTWVYLYLYPEKGDPVPVGWVQVGDDHLVTVSLKSIPPGLNKLAFVSPDGAIVGWTTAQGPDAPDGVETKNEASVASVVEDLIENGATFWTWLLIALAVFVVLGSAAAAIALRTPPNTGPPAPPVA